MKIDFDSILYIVITIVIVVISALGSRRKKLLQQTQATSAAKPAPAQADRKPETSTKPGSTQTADPLSRLEQFLTGQMPEAYSMEGESLETVEDEEELILEDIRKSREEEETEEKSQDLTIDEPYRIHDEIQATAIIPGEDDIEKITTYRKTMPALFENVDEIKRAIIYSEILSRKYE